MILVEVVGVRIEMPSNQPIVLLKEVDGHRFLPVWIGAVEATAIAFAQQGITPGRPLTHDLLRNTIEAMGGTVTAVHITAMREGIFFANLLIRDASAKGYSVDARPSDAIALALRTTSNILVSSDLLDEAGIEIPLQEGEGVDAEMEKFREFLEEIDPEDFGS